MVERHHLFPHLDTVRVVPVGASGQSSRGAGAVAVTSRSISSRRSALSAVVHASRSGLVFALRGTGLSLRTSTVDGGCGRGRAGWELLHTVVRGSGYTRHIPGRGLKEIERRKRNFSSVDLCNYYVTNCHRSHSFFRSFQLLSSISTLFIPLYLIHNTNRVVVRGRPGRGGVAATRGIEITFVNHFCTIYWRHELAQKYHFSSRSGLVRK